MNFKKTLLAVALTLSAGFAMAADLPQVAILATGGTIAGTAASATQTTGYKAGDLAIQTLIDAVPQIKDYATVTGEQIVKISSNNLTRPGPPDASQALQRASRRSEGERHRHHARYGHA